MKCDRCGYDDHGTGDTAHYCPLFKTSALSYAAQDGGQGQPDLETAAIKYADRGSSLIKPHVQIAFKAGAAWQAAIATKEAGK